MIYRVSLIFTIVNGDRVKILTINRCGIILRISEDMLDQSSTTKRCKSCYVDLRHGLFWACSSYSPCFFLSPLQDFLVRVCGDIVYVVISGQLDMDSSIA